MGLEVSDSETSTKGETCETQNTTKVESQEDTGTSTIVETTVVGDTEIVEIPKEWVKYLPENSATRCSKAELEDIKAFVETEKENEEYEEKLLKFKQNKETIEYYDEHSYEFIRDTYGMNEEEWEKFKTDTKNLGDELGEDVSKIRLKYPRPQDIDFDYDPNEIIDDNDKLPYEFKLTEKNSRFMWDNYLFRIPFSRKMPKVIYDKLMAIEVVRKLRDLKNTQLSRKDIEKYYPALIDSIIGDFDLNSILGKFKKHYHAYKSVNFEEIFEDIKLEEGKYVTIPTSQEYPIFTITDAFDGKLPENVPSREIKEYNELKGLVENYYQKKQLGYIFPDGMLKIKDSRPITEEDNPWRMRTFQWQIESNIEKWEFRCRVIKGEMMSLEQALAKGLPHPTDTADERLAKEIEKKHNEMSIEPHPRDPSLVMVDGKPCNKDLIDSTPKSNYNWPPVNEEAEMEMLEDQFIDAFLTMEEIIKEAKAEFKTKKEFYKSQGVAIKSVERAVKALRRELKRKPEDKIKEDAVYSRISRRMDIMNKITGIEAMAI